MQAARQEGSSAGHAERQFAWEDCAGVKVMVEEGTRPDVTDDADSVDADSVD